MVINMRIALLLTFPGTALVLLFASSGPVGRIGWWCGASWQTVGLGRSCFNLFASVCCVSSTSARRGPTIAHHCYKGLEEPSLFTDGTAEGCAVVADFTCGCMLVPSSWAISWCTWSSPPLHHLGRRGVVALRKGVFRFRVAPLCCRISRRPFVRHSERFSSPPVPRPGRLHMRTAACGSSLSPIHRDGCFQGSRT